MNIDGKNVSLKRKDEIKQKIQQLQNEGKRIPKLVVILVGNNQASQVYVIKKKLVLM